MASYIPLISLLLLISSMAASVVSVVLLTKAVGYIRSFALMMAAVALWSFGYGMELSAESLSSALWWIRLEYIGIALLPAIWLAFILKFSGIRPNLPLKICVTVSLLPIVTLLLAWSTPLHTLLYQEANMVEEGGAFLLSITPGIWYHVHTSYFYLSLVAGLGLLFQNTKSGVLYRRQRNVIAFAVGLPWLINMFYQSRLRPYEHLDLTPLAFLFTMIIIGLGLYRYRLMDLLPLARNKVLHAMQEGVLILDTQLRVSDFNPAAVSMLGAQYPVSYGSQLNRENPLSLLLNEIKVRVEETSDTAESVAEALEMQVINSQGQEQWLSCTVSAISHEGETEGYLMLIRDISKEKDYLHEINQKSDELEQLNSYKDQLFSIVAHDMKGPISRLVALLSLLDDETLTSEQVIPLISQVRQESTSTYSMLENLLYWTRSQLKGIQLNPAKISIQETIAAIVENERSRLDEKSLTIQKKIEGQLYAFADADMIQIVFRNLLSNAIKFSQPSGSITICAVAENDHVRIFVKDEGVGISQEVIRDLFSTSIKSSRGTRQEKGTGIGLQLCRQLLELNHGSIAVESEDGKGTTVHVCLPLKYPEKPRQSHHV